MNYEGQEKSDFLLHRSFENSSDLLSFKLYVFRGMDISLIDIFV